MKTMLAAEQTAVQPVSAVLRCALCKGTLTSGPDSADCTACGQTYAVRDGILVMQEPDEIDLRIGTQLLDIHAFRSERRFFDRTVESDVEYAARLHSLDFPNLHAHWLAPHVENAVVVDLGCGQLPYINEFPDSLAGFIGLDLSGESLHVARRNFCRSFPLTLVQHGIADVPLADGCADAVVSSEVIEHLDDPHAYLREAQRLCRRGGLLSLSTPCASMYCYPHNVRLLVRNPSSWWKLMNPQQCWSEALAWHPALRPAVLRRWVRTAGFDVVRHETRLWYYHTPLRPEWRLFEWLERRGLTSAGAWFGRCLRSADRLLAGNVPMVKWLGIRQFVLARKR
jgi:SAM-dependent methyltransferase